MMKKSFVLLLLIAFTSCNEVPTELKYGARDYSLVSDGKKLYQENCMSCHGALKNSLLKDRSASEIDALSVT